MTSTLPLPDLLLAITVLLTISAVVVPIARWIGIGPQLGLLLSGIILGSSHMLNPAQVARVRELSELGVVFFLFVIGLELDPRKAWSMRQYVLGLGALQVLMTGFALMFYWRLFTASWSVALLLGLVLANSSTALVLQLLQAKGELDQQHGQAAFAVLLFQDLTVVPIMALVPVFSGSGSADPISWWNTLLALGLMVALFVVGRYLCPRLLRLASSSHMSESFSAVVFIAMLGSAWLASGAGLSMAMGAFVMGVSLAGSEFRHSLSEEVTPLKNLLLGLFFVSVGLSIDVSVLSGHTRRILTHVVAILVVKVLVLYVVARLMKMQHGQAARVSCLLAQAGEFGFVILGALLASGVVTPIQFSSGIMVIALTTVMTPWMDTIGTLWSRRDGPVPG